MGDSGLNLVVEREWLVFFRDRPQRGWWDIGTHPGWRHVSAAAWFPMAQAWIFYDPTMKATAIVALQEPHSGRLMQQWVDDATAIVRFKSRAERGIAPAFFGCVAAVKALLGLRSCALSPRALHRHLLACGAEDVPVPRSESLGDPVRR